MSKLHHIPSVARLPLTIAIIALAPIITASAELKSGTVFRDCAEACPEMVVVPAGSSTMGLGKPEIYAGDPDREMLANWQLPQHVVSFAKPFAVARYETTIAEWTACYRAGACNGPPSLVEAIMKKRPPERTAVYDVSWLDAIGYIEWLSKLTGKRYRLLTEAEWEHAARAGSTTLYPWGDDVGTNNGACSNCGPEAPKPPVIGSYPPNNFGLYDTVGGVPEWVQDCFHENYTGAPSDGSVFEGGDCGQRMVRGGMSSANAIFFVRRSGWQRTLATESSD